MILSRFLALSVSLTRNHHHCSWLAWGATMADNDKDFHAMADPIFAQANATTCRVPLTDLFDTVSATCAYGKKAFVARPVVGGVYAKMLAPGPYPW